uniref:Uncharacterized protein n=1 Tax=Kuenenia stuttgartiensis TaxID=174633 RepID=Q1Q4C3_KUEST|nr:unknown protein [Candidatus Kuenenia stuttgartiensis]
MMLVSIPYRCNETSVDEQFRIARDRFQFLIGAMRLCGSVSEHNVYVVSIPYRCNETQFQS